VRYLFSAPVEARQFDGSNASELNDFIKRHVGVQALSHRQMGRDAPIVFDTMDGTFGPLRMLTSDWAVDFDGHMVVVTDAYFTRHFSAAQ
jgi:hypothetical protein